LVALGVSVLSATGLLLFDMTNWTIRRAKAADAPSLAKCIDAAYSVYAGRTIELPAVSDGIAENIQHDQAWVAVLGRQIIGGLVLVLHEDHAVVANVAVDPSATGSGLGRALMDRAELEAQMRGLGKLKLTTHVDIQENVRLYEHLGWRETGRAGKKVFMEKTLTS